MLILSRKAGEKIVIGSAVTVTVLAVTGNKLKIGIEAPVQIQIRGAVLANQIAGSIEVVEVTGLATDP